MKNIISDRLTIFSGAPYSNRILRACLFHLLKVLLHRFFDRAEDVFVAGAAVHGLWNIGVYYYLWGNTVTRVISRLYGLSANAISFTFSELYTAISLA